MATNTNPLTDLVGGTTDVLDTISSTLSTVENAAVHTLDVGQKTAFSELKTALVDAQKLINGAASRAKRAAG
jgi:hypothetical protein